MATEKQITLYESLLEQKAKETSVINKEIVASILVAYTNYLSVSTQEMSELIARFQLSGFSHFPSTHNAKWSFFMNKLTDANVTEFQKNMRCEQNFKEMVLSFIENTKSVMETINEIKSSVKKGAMTREEAIKNLKEFDVTDAKLKKFIEITIGQLEEGSATMKLF